MTDKEKIRKEVVEIINSINLFTPDEDGKNSDYEAGKLDAATQILQIIDSLEKPASEKKCMFTKDIYTDEDRKVLCEDCDEICEYSKKEELVSKDFEMALAEMIDKAQKNVIEPWVVAAQWKDELIELAKSEEPVSDDLEQAAVEAFKKIVDSNKNSFLEIFKAGAKWQKEKMLENAVDGIITFDYYSNDDKEYGCIAHDSFCLEDRGLNDKDKVKLIILK